MPNTQVLGTDPGLGISGFGTTLKGTTTGVLGMMDKVAIDGIELDVIDISTMNSTGAWKTFVAGMKDAKSVSFDLVYEPKNTSYIMAALGIVDVWTIKLPDTCTFVASGMITKLGTQSPKTDKISQSMTIKFSGPLTYSIGSGVTN